MDELQMVAFEMISNAGEASANFLKAIKEAEDGNFEEAQHHMKLGKEASLIAHKIQTSLITKEASGEKNELGILMIHAQDHLMNSILLKDLAQSFISLNKRLSNLEGK